MCGGVGVNQNVIVSGQAGYLKFLDLDKHRGSRSRTDIFGMFTDVTLDAPGFVIHDRHRSTFTATGAKL